MLRKRGKKCVYTLPRINPRAANLNTMEDAQKLGREIQDDVMEFHITPLTLSQKGKRTELKYVTMAQTSRTTTQGGRKQTSYPQATATQSE